MERTFLCDKELNENYIKSKLLLSFYDSELGNLNYEAQFKIKSSI